MSEVHPRRKQIVAYMLRGHNPASFSDLKNGLGIPDGTLDFHLRKLKEENILIQKHGDYYLRKRPVPKSVWVFAFFLAASIATASLRHWETTIISSLSSLYVLYQVLKYYKSLENLFFLVKKNS